MFVFIAVSSFLSFVLRCFFLRFFCGLLTRSQANWVNLVSGKEQKPPRNFKRTLGYTAPAPTATRRMTFAELAAANKASNSTTPPPSVKTAPPTRPTQAATKVVVEESAPTSANPRAPSVAYRTRGTLPTSSLTDADRQQQMRLLEDGITTVGTAVSKRSC